MMLAKEGCKNSCPCHLQGIDRFQDDFRREGEEDWGGAFKVTEIKAYNICEHLKPPTSDGATFLHSNISWLAGANIASIQLIFQ